MKARSFSHGLLRRQRSFATSRRKKAEPEAEAEVPVKAMMETPIAEEAPAPEAANDAAPPKRRRTKKAVEAEAAAVAEAAADEDDDGTPRRGWWQRTFGA